MDQEDPSRNFEELRDHFEFCGYPLPEEAKNIARSLDVSKNANDTQNIQSSQRPPLPISSRTFPLHSNGPTIYRMTLLLLTAKAREDPVLIALSAERSVPYLWKIALIRYQFRKGEKSF